MNRLITIATEAVRVDQWNYPRIGAGPLEYCTTCFEFGDANPPWVRRQLVPQVAIVDTDDRLIS
jgi:hypothetical protein